MTEISELRKKINDYAIEQFEKGNLADGNFIEKFSELEKELEIAFTKLN